jgi:HAE1 family hydrophobic/amphiphilic exporter-1
MKLADVSIRRPVFAVMMSLALVVLGLFSYRTLGVDLMPKTEVPVVQVRVGLPGASAEEIESQITKPIEAAVNTVDGLDELNAFSNQGFGFGILTFNLEKDMQTAVQDVRDKMAGIQGQFPRDATPVQVTKSDPDSGPILTLAVSGNRDPKELTEIADKRIKQVLESAAGVGEIQISGDRRRQVQLRLDADRMTAYGLTVDQVRIAIQRQNVEIPGGQFTTERGDIALRTMGRLDEVRDFNRIILSQKDGRVITFGDIGRVVDEMEEQKSLALLDGRTSIALGVVKQPGTNTVAVVDNVLARVAQIKRTLPADIEIAVRRDQSIFIRRSIDDIQHHLILGSILASIIVLFFLRNGRSTLIAATSIPVSLIGTFIVMKIMGLTLNNMTLLSLSLATGIVIDDANVVLENIFRYVEEKGVSPRVAAAEATGEIGLAVMATTLSLVVIFLPVVFITGQIGQYLLAFGIASAVAIVLSMFVAFTLTPALCANWLRASDAAGHGNKSKDKGIYAAIDRTYGRMLEWSLHHRAIMLVIAVMVSLSAVLLFPHIGRELVPEDDQGEFSVNIDMARGTPFATTRDWLKDADGILKNLPEVQTVFTSINSARANYFVGLTPLEKRSISTQTVMRQARAILTRRYPGMTISVSGGTDISGASSAGGGYRGGGGGGNRLQLLVQGADMDQLQAYTLKLLEKLRAMPGVADAKSNVETTQEELRVVVDRVRASDLGVNIDSLASSLRTLVGGEEVSRLKQGDESYEVNLRLDEQFRNDPAKVGELLVPAAGGRVVRVSDIAQLRLERAPSQINRYQRQRNFQIQAVLDGIPLGDAITGARQRISELNMKPGYQVVFGGTARTLETASNDFALAMLLAVVFIYMVLASQFNSFVQPLVIMTALPLSLPAGLLALMAFGMTLNIYSGIGMLMLFGIVKKNSILQVDYTNTLRAQGMERHEALMTASHVRLRPILMTTLAIVAGMLPIAFGRGSGAGSRASMAVTIIGGQILCLLLTLLVTPVVYSYFDDLREWSPAAVLSRFRTWRAARAAAVVD